MGSQIDALMNSLTGLASSLGLLDAGGGDGDAIM